MEKKEIRELTPEQEKLMEQRKVEWEAISKCCDPADFDKGEAAIIAMYNFLGKKPPKFVRVRSPFAAQIAVNAFKTVFLPNYKTEAKTTTDSDNEKYLKIMYGELQNQVIDDIKTSIARASISDEPKIITAIENLMQRIVKIEFCNTSLWGQQDAYWIAFYKFCEEIGVVYEPKDSQILEMWSEIAKSHMWWWPFDDYCFVCDRPTAIHFNERGFLHHPTEAAIAFRDGYEMFAVNGVRVPNWVIKQPELLLPKHIDGETNAEVRRVMFEQYENRNGKGSYMIAGGGRLIHQDEWGKVWRKDFPDDEPLIQAEVLNSTPESDGHFKTYFLRVPERGGKDWAVGEKEPIIKTARQAVAWTFGKLEKEYNPEVQT